ncbi:hypothetical protein A2U01_0081079, partial [Trifolium medium]|nr:hypothetical protein [Trifolium medium]
CSPSAILSEEETSSEGAVDGHVGVFLPRGLNLSSRAGC